VKKETKENEEEEEKKKKTKTELKITSRLDNSLFLSERNCSSSKFHHLLNIPNEISIRYVRKSISRDLRLQLRSEFVQGRFHAFECGSLILVLVVLEDLDHREEVSVFHRIELHEIPVQSRGRRGERRKRIMNEFADIEARRFVRLVNRSGQSEGLHFGIEVGNQC